MKNKLIFLVKRKVREKVQLHNHDPSPSPTPRQYSNYFSITASK